MCRKAVKLNSELKQGLALNQCKAACRNILLCSNNCKSAWFKRGLTLADKICRNNVARQASTEKKW
jgi:hypothetical protein